MTNTFNAFSNIATLAMSFSPRWYLSNAVSMPATLVFARCRPPRGTMCFLKTARWRGSPFRAATVSRFPFLFRNVSYNMLLFKDLTCKEHVSAILSWPKLILANAIWKRSIFRAAGWNAHSFCIVTLRKPTFLQRQATPSTPPKTGWTKRSLPFKAFRDC